MRTWVGEVHLAFPLWPSLFLEQGWQGTGRRDQVSCGAGAVPSPLCQAPVEMPLVWEQIG